jgi:cell division septum initiation protein DivIVA
MPLAPTEIDSRPLRARRGHYRREDVDALLAEVRSSYEEVWRERDRLRARVDELQGEAANRGELERLLRDGLASAQRAAEEARAEARRETERVLEEARRRGEQMLEEARHEAETLRAVSARRAEEAVGDVVRTRDRLKHEIARLRSVEREARERFRAELLEALRIIEPEEPEEPAAAEATDEPVQREVAGRPGEPDALMAEASAVQAQPAAEAPWGGPIRPGDDVMETQPVQSVAHALAEPPEEAEEPAAAPAPPAHAESGSTAPEAGEGEGGAAAESPSEGAAEPGPVPAPTEQGPLEEEPARDDEPVDDDLYLTFRNIPAIRRPEPPDETLDEEPGR